MRHGRKINHLGRTAAHRKSLLSNLASSLIIHKRINTTVAKAKELRKYVEPILTRAKEDTTHSRRIVFSYLQNKDSVKALFNEVAEKIAERPGGYTRIIKTGNRLGDNADMCMIELVDFNELLLAEGGEKKAKTRRSRRGGKVKKTGSEAAQAIAPEDNEVKEDLKKAAPEAKTESSKKTKAKKEESKEEKPKKGKVNPEKKEKK